MSTWYRVYRWAMEPEAVEVARETESMIVLESGGRRKKSTSYETWFPTEREALSHIAEMRSAERAREDRRRMRDAAPDLLEALANLIKQRDHRANSVEGAMHLWDDARAAIAKATGGAL